MYGEEAFKPPAHPYCFHTKAKEDDVPLVQIEEIEGLLGGIVTSIMVALASVWQRLLQAGTEAGEDVTTDIVLALEELDSPASTHLGHALRLTASSFNSLSEKRRKEAVSKSWENKSELVDMLNREYSPCVGSCSKVMKKVL